MMETTNLKTDMPESVTEALRYLLQTAAAEKVTVFGFAIQTDPPAVTNFGNCADKSDIRLYEYMCKLTGEKLRAGNILKELVSRPV
jgi:hypothetical protein